MNNPFSYCHKCIHQPVCPLYHTKMRMLGDFDDFDDFDGFDGFENFNDFNSEDFPDDFRASQQEVNRILRMLNTQKPQLSRNFERYGVSRVLVNTYFRIAINYTLDNASKHSGNISQRTNAILNSFRRSQPWIFAALRAAGVPVNVINETFREVIEFTLRNMSTSPIPGGWSQWEDLGGVLTSAPGVSSWAPNRLDTFVRGTDNALYHKWWNGSRWSDWENLGGNLTSAPSAVSWGNNRIDVFARGQGNRLYHLWWNGVRWSSWQDLDGNITSAPAVSSRADNRLEVFARGQNNQLMTMSWNGTRWSNWSNLGGTLTSDPSAVSWGPNRTDVFARGTNNAMWHIYRN
ncbi:MAG: DUF346 domain-containing protein [Bacillota bacterium]|nr:DUF346 domain-containing protein [Bacillota bacterium]